MLLGGLWHGAGWTFVLWGGLHGGYLIVNHLWHAMRPRLGLLRAVPTRISLLAGAGLTFVAVVVAWVPFRAASFAQAARILAGMVGLNGFELPVPLEDGSLLLAWVWIVSLLGIVWLAPNTQEIMAGYLPQMRHRPAAREQLRWRPTLWHAAATAAAAVVALGYIGEVSEFLYFQF